MKKGKPAPMPLLSPIPNETRRVLMDQDLDSLALRVAGLPGFPLTVSQAERLRIIGRELLRRAGEDTDTSTPSVVLPHKTVTAR